MVNGKDIHSKPTAPSGLSTVCKGEIVTPQFHTMTRCSGAGTRAAVQLHLVDVSIVNSYQHAVFICCAAGGLARCFPSVWNSSHAAGACTQGAWAGVLKAAFNEWARAEGGATRSRRTNRMAESPAYSHVFACCVHVSRWTPIVQPGGNVLRPRKNCTSTFSVDYKESGRA